jgi:hypothetical protein
MFKGMHARHARKPHARAATARWSGGGRLWAMLLVVMMVLGFVAPGVPGSAAAQTPPSPVPTATATGSITG